MLKERHAHSIFSNLRRTDCVVKDVKGVIKRRMSTDIVIACHTPQYERIVNAQCALLRNRNSSDAKHRLNVLRVQRLIK